MANIFAPGLKALKQTTILKTRELPIGGRVLVKEGDIVAASDIVLQADLPGNLNILRVSERLGIEPDEVLKGVKKRNLNVGSSVKVGDILCEHNGLFGLLKNRFEASHAGTIEYISESNGHIGIREASIPLSINAYISGKIINIVPGKAVTIEATGALVQGIFGVGGEQTGKLVMLEVSPDRELTVSDIPEDCRGAILVGGMSPGIDVLKRASELGAKGLVVGSIDDKALTSYLGYDLGVAITGDEELSMTLIITEGFGRLPISDRVLDVLRDFDSQEVSINGATQVRAGAIRPEIIAIHSGDRSSVTLPVEEIGLNLGLRVRMIRVPFFGLYGEIVELPHDVATIETGAKTRILKARLDNGSVVSVPRANVEIVS
jgi:hypothetical protein